MNNRPELKVWYGSMPESNGKTNWTAILYCDGDIYSGITIDRSEYPDRVRYEADRMRFMIGEISEEPDILAYDPDLHSGYKKPKPFVYCVVGHGTHDKDLLKTFDTEEKANVYRASDDYDTGDYFMVTVNPLRVN